MVRGGATAGTGFFAARGLELVGMVFRCEVDCAGHYVRYQEGSGKFVVDREEMAK